MNKAYKFRIYPNTEQTILLAKTYGCVRFIYNHMLADRIEHYNHTGKRLANTPAQYKAEYEWLREVDSLALANAQMNLQKAYNNFFRDTKTGFPKYKSKKSNRQSHTTNCVNGNIRLKEGYLRLPKVGEVKVKQHREIPEHYTLKSVTISKTSSGKYFASILYEYEEKIEDVKPVNITGLDFSMKELYVSSEGEHADYPQYYRKALMRLKREQRKLSKCQKGSRNRDKQRINVAKLHEKVTNQRKDFLHKKSKQITNAYDMVCIEDLDMKGMSQALNFGKSVADNSFGMFVGFLDYKLKEQGKRLVKIDKWFPSSKMCSRCGRKKESLSLSDRVYECECGNVMDRDTNAAINIKREGMSLVMT
jgi:putative transposase